jgi:Na+/H+ antiporter NhaD/arsenite permease-like protein
MSVGLAISLGIFGLIAAREWLPEWLKIWHVMLAGALTMLATGQIGPRAALAAIDWNIIAYLFAVFSIGTALHLNGLSHRIADRLAGLRSARVSLAAFVVCFAALSSILTNDAAAIIGTPIALVLAARAGVRAKAFLIALCVTVTIASMATPIGNPQNLLIAASGHVPAPLLTFMAWLVVPTVVSLAMAVWWLARSLPPGEAEAIILRDSEFSAAGRLWPSLLAVGLLVGLVAIDSLLSALGDGRRIPLGVAACLAGLPVYLFGPMRKATFLGTDWRTLIFFVAMFVVTGALVESGSMQRLLGEVRDRLTEPLVTASVAFFGSQVFSNVPLVDMYLKLLGGYSTDNLMMLAAVSTLAGNVFIISAASNVIVLQQSESMGGPSISFTEFFKAVLPVGVFSLVFTVLWVLVFPSLLSLLS